ncbi:TniQ family protein [Maliponia aquimaris]|nr:TniQ family protein [Maliponia aquimaris]
MPLDPEETLLSYADRLSLMHTGKGMERLLKDLGIRRDHFVSGRPETVDLLAEATSHDADLLRRGAIRVHQLRASFRGQDISKTFLSPRAGRYCPECLSEDGARDNRRFRLIWGFRHVARCGRHAVWLSETPYPNDTNLRSSLGMSPLGKAMRADEEAPEYMSWLAARLNGNSPADANWLAGQTIQLVLKSSEMLGVVLEHGHKFSPAKLTPAQTEEATDIGFSIYRDGPEAVEEALDTIRKTSPASAVQAGPLAYYGQLFDWLDRRSNALDPGPIRDILRDHIVKHSAVEPGTKVLGVEITERRYHTVKSLARAVGIDRVRLARLLEKIQLVPKDATEVETGNMVFEAATAVPLIKAFKTAVPLQDVPRYIGASKRQIEILYRVGILQPLTPRTGRGSVRHVVFARGHLDALLEKVSNLPIAAMEQVDDLHQLAFAAQRGAGRFEDLFADVLEGRIEAFRRPDLQGVGAIQVNVYALIDRKTPA